MTPRETQGPEERERATSDEEIPAAPLSRPAPALGSEDWIEELAALGPDRVYALPIAEKFLALLRFSFSSELPGGVPHFGVLIHQADAPDVTVLRWIARQFVGGLIHGSERLVGLLHDEIWNLLRFDDRESRLLFPALAREFPPNRMRWLLDHARALPWSTRRALEEARAPTLFREGSPPVIGSPSWENELHECGWPVTRAPIDALVKAADPTVGYVDIDATDPGPYELGHRFVLEAATEVLLDQQGAPTGEDARLWHWVGGHSLDEIVRRGETVPFRWYSRQIAARVLHGSSEVRSDTLSQLEHTLRSEVALGTLLYPWLIEDLGESWVTWLACHAEGVRWDAKQSVCEQSIERIFSESPVPPIGSDEWSHELGLVGITVDEVDALYEDCTLGESSESCSPESYDFGDVQDRLSQGRLGSLLEQRGRRAAFDEDNSPASRAIEGAARFLAHVETGSTLDWIRTKVWGYRDQAHDLVVRRWCARQLASLFVHGSEAARSTDGALRWEFLEFEAVSTQLVPWLVQDIPTAYHPSLLDRLATATWVGKKHFYNSFAATPAYHARLAQALLDATTSGIFHSIEAREALELVRRLDAADPALRTSVERVLTTPLGVTIVAIAEPADDDVLSRYPGCFFAALSFASPLPMWLLESDLFDGELKLGDIASFAHGLYPDGPTKGRSVPGKPARVKRRVDTSSRNDVDKNTASAEARPTGAIGWHCLRGAIDESLARLGTPMEFRPRLD